MGDMHTWPPRQPERNPLEIWLFIWITVGTFALAWGLAPLPFSLSETPFPFGQAAILLLWFGALLGGVGLAWRNRYTGLRVEQFGVMLFGVGSVLWATAVADAVGWPLESAGTISVSMSAGLAIGCGFRFWQILKYLDRRRAFEREMQAAEPVHVDHNEIVNEADEGGQ